jgi:protein-S-isoprenylcysteine O-methyltransferase Ste14
MENNKSFIPGYIIGGSIVIVVLPTIFYLGSQKLDSYFGASLIEDSTIRFFLSFILFATGLLFSLWSIIIQNKVGKGGPFEGYKISVSPKTQKLNVTGPYKYTRNPMLFGACLLYFSLSLFFNSLTFLLFVFLFTVFMVIFVRNTEEKRLLADFGEEYKAYRKRTSLFIPLPPKKI